MKRCKKVARYRTIVNLERIADMMNRANHIADIHPDNPEIVELAGIVTELGHFCIQLEVQPDEDDAQCGDKERGIQDTGLPTSGTRFEECNKDIACIDINDD